MLGRTLALAVLAAVQLAACGGSTLDIGVETLSFGTDAYQGLVLHVRDRSDSRTLTSRDFGNSAANPLPHVVVDVADQGPLRIAVLVVERGDTIADAAFSFALQDDYAWGLTLVRGVSNPAHACFGCRGSARIDIAAGHRTTPDEAFWAVWGGKPRGSDIVY